MWLRSLFFQIYLKCFKTRKYSFTFRLIFCCAVIPALPPVHPQTENGTEKMDICAPELSSLKDEVGSQTVVPSNSIPVSEDVSHEK